MESKAHTSERSQDEISQEKVSQEMVSQEMVSQEMVSQELPKLLAVEDNPEMLMLLRHILSVNWDVHTGISMQTALAEIDAHQFEIVLMDINLGTKETGVDVLQEIRRRSSYKDTPVVAVTAYALPGDRERFLDEGFDAYIGKPFTRQQLTRLIDSIVRKK